MNIGDRIELLSMPDDPDPVPTGTQGTVESITRVPMRGKSFTQVGVKWDNGRTLSLVMPPDRVKVVT